MWIYGNHRKPKCRQPSLKNVCVRAEELVLSEPFSIHITDLEQGVYATSKLRQSRNDDLYPWSPIPEKKRHLPPITPARDLLRLTRYYRSPLDSSQFKSRADLARFLGASGHESRRCSTG